MNSKKTSKTKTKSIEYPLTAFFILILDTENEGYIKLKAIQK